MSESKNCKIKIFIVIFSNEKMLRFHVILLSETCFYAGIVTTYVLCGLQLSAVASVSKSFTKKIQKNANHKAFLTA